MKTERVLFLGNGINCVKKSDISWHHVIKDLVKYAGVEKEIRIADKPFPLLYEEIVLTSARKGKKDEKMIKKYIAAEMAGMKPNELHFQIAQSAYEHLITTNYDRTLEKAFPGADLCSNCGKQFEQKYNIFRENRANHTHIWHIHGDAESWQSIVLGYEQYGGQLQRMRGYIATGTGDSYKIGYPPLIRELRKKQTPTGWSWLNLFFTHEIHIVGFSFDLVEIDLWWLLSYRSRVVLLEKKLPSLPPVYYYYPKPAEKSLASRLSLLQSFGVKTIAQPGIGKEHYQSVFSQIEKLH